VGARGANPTMPELQRLVADAASERHRCCRRERGAIEAGGGAAIRGEGAAIGGG
jgi:hypothetical protein